MDHPLEKVEKELIRIIHKNVEDFKRKIAEFQMFVSVELKESMTGVVEGLKGHLRIITDLKNNFDRMDTKDILTLNLDCKSDLNFIPKSVKELKKLCEMIEKPLKLEELLANGLPVKC